MKKEYIVFTKKKPSVEKGTNHKMLYNIICLRNNISKKVKYLNEISRNTDSSKIKTYVVAPRGSRRAQHNNIAHQRLNDLKRDIERMRDSEGKSWYMWIEDVDNKIKENLTNVYFDSIEFLLGTYSKVSVKRYKSFVDNHLPFLVGITHKSVSKPEIYQLVLNTLSELKKSNTNEYLSKQWEMFNASTKKAYDLGLVDKIPMNFKVPDKFFRYQKSDIYFASNEELEKLDKVDIINHPNLKYTNMSTRLTYDDIRKAWLFSAIYTGLRPQSMEILKWSQIKEVDTEYGRLLRIDVDPNKEGVSDYWLLTSIDAYEYLGKRGNDDDYVFHYYPRVGVGGFENNNSKSAQLSRNFQNICKHSGIKNSELTMRQCRHTHAYKTLQSTNNDMMKVSKRLGHKSMATTEKHYARFLKDYQEETCNQVMSFKKYQVLK